MKNTQPLLAGALAPFLIPMLRIHAQLRPSDREIALEITDRLKGTSEDDLMFRGILKKNFLLFLNDGNSIVSWVSSMLTRKAEYVLCREEEKDIAGLFARSIDAELCIFDANVIYSPQAEDFVLPEDAAICIFSSVLSSENWLEKICDHLTKNTTCAIIGAYCILNKVEPARYNLLPLKIHWILSESEILSVASAVWGTAVEKKITV